MPAIKMKVKFIAITATVILSAYFILAPFLTSYNLKRAITESDVKAFSEVVDFESLKDNLRVSVMKGVSKENISDDLFAKTIVDSMMESAMDPVFILSQIELNPDAEFKLRYRTFNRFVIANVKSKKEVVMERKGIFDWKVVNIK